jgi:hypothetical protein
MTNASAMYVDCLREIEAKTKLMRPPPSAWDWTSQARRTTSDLATSPSATTTEYGDLYAMPYVAGQYPDVMVQLTLCMALHRWNHRTGQDVPLERKLRAGVHRFYDADVGTFRRYLPNVGGEKDYDAVDSWYLYHPMMSLARLASGGDGEALDLLLRSVDYGIRAARHFDYAWPVFFKIDDFNVITQQADEGRPGETDAGGLYAYLMVQLYELTGKARFLNEARVALAAADAKGLDLMYQANLTAWGAAASLKIWELTSDDGFLHRTHYWLANLFRHCCLEERSEGFAGHYPTAMGVPCMYNSDYMAPFEDMECYMALGEIRAIGGDALEPAAVSLAASFRHRARHRGRFFYPDQLPSEAISTDQESGVIDRKLAFPLEDLYFDGRAAGQIGQEIYGAGMAIIYALS